MSKEGSRFRILYGLPGKVKLPCFVKCLPTNDENLVFVSLTRKDEDPVLSKITNE